MTPDWPYPRWVAHRGAGKLAPENTLSAFKLGAENGYRMFECDVKLSSDGIPFLLHDDTLERTTNGHGIAGLQTWAALQKLDAGAWHSGFYKGEPLPSLETIAAWCIANNFDLNIEIKPTTGADALTGEIVASHAARLWQTSSRKPLLTSFKPDALQAAQDSAPGLPRGLLLHELWTGWLETALMLGCQAIVCRHSLWDRSSVTQAKSADFKTLSYTVNDQAEVQRLLALGTDGIITDRVDQFKL
jgi:glycerophosphoryl diester phosphodiesterase